LNNFQEGTLSIQNYWVYGLCPLSGILNTRKNNVLESFLRGEEEYTYYVGSLRKSRPQ
jgi:hypothetical protein